MTTTVRHLSDSEGGYAILFGGRFGPERLNDLFMLTFNSEGSGEMEWSLLLPSTDDLTAQTLNVPIGRSWHTFTSLSNNNFLLYGGYSTDDRPLSGMSKSRHYLNSFLLAFYNACVSWFIAVLETRTQNYFCPKTAEVLRTFILFRLLGVFIQPSGSQSFPMDSDEAL